MQSPSPHAILSKRLTEIIGTDDKAGVEVLTEYVWRMITTTTHKEAQMIEGLQEFLGDETKDFVSWLMETIVPHATYEPADQITNATYETTDQIPNQEEVGSSGARIFEDAVRKVASGSQSARQHTREYATQPRHSGSRSERKIERAPRRDYSDGRSVKREVHRERERSPRNSANSPPERRSYGQDFTRRKDNPPREDDFHQLKSRRRDMGSGAARFPHERQMYLEEPRNRGPPVSTVRAPWTTPAKIKVRCPKFPKCEEGDRCMYIHPVQMCANFPRCIYSNSCFYIHPEIACRYGASCYNMYCNFTHPEGWAPQTNNVYTNTDTGVPPNSGFNLGSSLVVGQPDAKNSEQSTERIKLLSSSIPKTPPPEETEVSK